MSKKFTYSPQWGIVVISQNEEQQKKLFEKLKDFLKNESVKLKIVVV